MLDIACVILTKDEELHMERCILSARKVCSDVWVVDSYSTDRTCEIAERLGAHVVQHSFSYQAEQFNWALDNVDVKTKWVYRIDADEEVTPELAAEIIENCHKHHDEQLVVAIGGHVIAGALLVSAGCGSGRIGDSRSIGIGIGRTGNVAA